MNESDLKNLGLPPQESSNIEINPERMEELIRHPLVQKVMAKQGWTSYQQIPPEIRQKLENLAGKLGQGEAATNRSLGISVEGSRQETPDWSRFSSPSDSPKIPKAAVVIVMIMLFSFILGFLISYFAAHHR